LQISFKTLSTFSLTKTHLALWCTSVSKHWTQAGKS